MIINKIKELSIEKPNLVAYIINNQSITYEELYKKIIYYGELLKRQNSKNIIIYGHKEIETLYSILACMYAKRTYIPIDNSIPLERIKNIINQIDDKLIISNEKINNIETTTLEELEKFKNNDIIDVKNNICYIIFTSGSTGIPKGVPITYDNLNNFVNWLCNSEYLKKYSNINVLNQANFNFDLSVCDIFYSLYTGNTLVGLEHTSYTDLEYIYNTIKNNNITFMVNTPTFVRMCLLEPLFNQNELPNLKCILFCGEVLDVSLARKLYERFPNITIINAYGPTEATCFVCMTEILKSDLENSILPVGDINTSCTDIKLENDQIILSGKSVFNGYLNIDSTNYTKINNINYFNTHDLGYIKNNRLYCTGRDDSQIKINGYRIELQEIEAVIEKLEYIDDSVVLAKKQDNKVKYIKVFVTTNKNITNDIIYNNLSKLLPYYMLPKYITILDKMPINNNGKIDRKVLSEL